MNKKYFFLFLCWLSSIAVNAQEYQTNIPVHDPVMIKQDSVYYLFCTGRGISMWSSKDMTNWKQEKPVFDTLPWAVQTIKGFSQSYLGAGYFFSQRALLFVLFCFRFWKKYFLHWCGHK